MTKTSAALVLTLAATVWSGCGNRILVGDSPDAGGPSGTAGSTGSAGTSGTGTGATAGTEATAGTVGPGFTGAAGAEATGGTVGPGFTGEAGTTGAAGATGAAGTTSIVVANPLSIPADQVAVRLSLALWDTMPDAALISQAGNLETTLDVYLLVQQMLLDPRARAGVGNFYRWWLDLADLETHQVDPTLFPTVTSQVLADMSNESETFGVTVTLDLGGSFQTLMTAPFSYINARLAALYGVANVAGDALQEVALPSGRAGLLTQPAFLTNYSYALRTSPTTRGRSVSQRFFCRQIPPPPPNTPPFGTPAPGVTGRAQMQALTSASAACGACHTAIDQLGFAFEGFDPVGRARTVDNGAPVDTSNLDIVGSTPSGAIVNGPVQLATLLANDPGAQDCMAQQWLSFVLGRDLQASDSASIVQIDETFKASNDNLQALIGAVLASDSFLSP